VGEEQPEQDVAAVGGGDDDASFEDPVEHVGHGHGGDDEPERLAVEQGLVTVGEAPLHGRHQLADGGGVQDRLRRDGVCRDVTEAARQGRRRGSDGLGRHPVGDDGEQPGVVGARLLRSGVGGRPRLLRGPAGAGDDQEHRGVEVGRDAGVVGELGRRGDVGVVGAEDEHRLEPLGHGVEALDDRRHGRVPVGVDVVVADARGDLR